MASTQVAARAASPSPFAVFRNRNFGLMWTGQLVSTMGTSLASLASSIYVYSKTGSALSVGLMLMATAAPSLLVGLVAGVFVDRYDRKRIMIAADIIRAVLVFLIPILVPHSITWLYVIVAIESAVGQFFEPAHSSLLPEVASDEELTAANSLMAISSFGSTAVGFAASGLIGSRSIALAFYLDALSFLFSAICILLIRAPRYEASERTSVAMVARNLRAGARVLIDTPILRSLFLISILVFVSFGLSNSLLLPFSLKALHATEFEYGLQEALTSIGFVVGSLAMARLAERLREGQWVAISYVGMALAGIGYSLMRAVPPAIAIIIFSGLFNAPSSIARRVIVQRHTPREVRGRVNSAFGVSRDVVFLLGMAAAGLADVMSVRLLYLASALLLLGAGLWTAFIPGLGQPAAEWRRALRLLRTAPATPGLGAGRAATLADFDRLAGVLPALAHLGMGERQALIDQANVSDAPAGATILRHGETSDAAYFVLAGKAVAGVATTNGGYRSLSTLTPGDFFGEIAALTGAPRTANVVAEEPVTLLQVPAAALRRLMTDPALSQLFLGKMSERLARTHASDLPRLAGLEQDALRELRTAEE